MMMIINRIDTYLPNCVLAEGQHVHNDDAVYVTRAESVWEHFPVNLS